MLVRCNLKETRRHVIKSDYGITDYYKYYKLLGGKLPYKTYCEILRDFNSRVADLLVNKEYSYKLPHRLGVITLAKKKNFVTFKKNKLIACYPINWAATLDLWEVNPEAAKEKKLIRFDNKHSNKFSYKFKYLKKFAKYQNKTIYKMQFNRQKLKYKVRDLIYKEGELERGLTR